MEWWIHRIATSGKYHSSLVEIQTEWSLDDILDATMILDLFAKMELDAYLQSQAR